MEPLANAEVIAFTATRDPERAKLFYGQTLGLALVEDSPFALVFSAGATMLRVQKLEVFIPAPYTVLGWKVDDIRATIEALVSRGVVFERYSFMQQDELGIWTTPDGSKVAWFRDADGNILSLTQFTAA